MRTPRNGNITGPETIEDFRKLARAKIVYVAPLYGMSEDMLRRRCIKGQIPGAVKKGTVWWVTPAGMDAYFDQTN